MRKIIFLLISLLISGLSLEAQNNLIAHYPLLKDGNDATGNNEAMTLINTPFQNGGIYCNGIYINSEREDAFEAVTPPIKNFNFASFAVSVDFFVTDFKTQPVIVCGAGCRWLGIYLNSDSTVSVFFNNQNTMPCNVKYSLNQWHNVKISYDGTTAGASLDDTLACLLDVALEYAVCGDSDTGIGVSNYGSGEVLEGHIKNLKVFANP